MTEKFPSLNLPKCNLKLTFENNILKVWDNLRKKNVRLTPEELVRQSFVAWMINALNYPESLMTNEKEVNLNNTKKRCDSIVFNPDGTPLLIVEYKSPSIEITQEVFNQIVRYNMVLRADYLIVSNGLKHYCCKMDYGNNTYHFIPRIPDYLELRRAK